MILRNLNIIGQINGKKDIVINGNSILKIISSGKQNNYQNDNELDFNGCIAFPGLINSHDHLEFNNYPKLGHKIYQDYVEWGNDIHEKDKEIIKTIEAIPIEIRYKNGIRKNLICGVTAVAHHGICHDSFYNSPVEIIESCCFHSVKLGGKWKLKLNSIKNSEPYVIHIGEGINKSAVEETDEFIKWNLFNRKTIAIHGISMTVEQSKHFTALVWCPDSNKFLFDKTADIKSLKHHTKILFGTDSTLTAPANLWEQLRKARALKLMSDEELFASLTTTAADVWDLDKTGRIAENYFADIVIAKQKKKDLFEAFYSVDPEDIVMVIKKGKVILSDECSHRVL